LPLYYVKHFALYIEIVSGTLCKIERREEKEGGRRKVRKREEEKE
jgi:hypothetical protein